MEPIKIETIEWAVDFFFRLNDQQLAEKTEDLKTRQIHMFTVMTVPTLKMKLPEQKTVFWKIMLIMDYCFRSYPIMLSEISKTSAERSIQDMIKRTKSNLNQSDDEESAFDSIKEIGQIELFNALINKLGDILVHEKLYHEDLAKEILMCMIFIGTAYQREVAGLMDRRDIN